MTVVLACRSDINLTSLERVAFGGEDVRFSEDALAAMARTHQQFQDYCASHADDFIYGVTSGYGPQAKRCYSLTEAHERATRSRPRRRPMPAFGGEPQPAHVVRAAAFAALAVFVEGDAAVAPQRAEEVARMLDGPLPTMPSRGLLAAGELMPNAVLFDTWQWSDEHGFAIGHGAQTSAAMAAVTAILSRRRLRLAGRIFALSAAAFGASPHLLAHLNRSSSSGDAHQDDALQGLLAWTSEVQPHRPPSDPPASYADLGRLLAQAYRSVATLEEVATISLRSIGGNPAFLAPSDEFPDGAVLHPGGYHNAQAAPAIDAVAASWVDLASLAHRYTVQLHKGRVSGLPDRLAVRGKDDETTHPAYSTAPLEWVPIDFISEMSRLAQPTLLTAREISSSDQDDMAITAPAAFRIERDVAKLLDAVLAVLAVTASQAFHVTGRPPPSPFGGLLAALRAVFPPVTSSRPLGVECERVAAALSDAIETGDVRMGLAPPGLATSAPATPVGPHPANDPSPGP